MRKPQGKAGSGWQRTGMDFLAWPSAETGAAPVCRFYGTPGRGPNFGVAILAWNVLAVLQEAVKARHDLQAIGIELSSYYLATEIKAQYAGMMTAIAVAAWQAYDALSTQQLADALLDLAAKVDPCALRKHPRGPKKPKKKTFAPRSEVSRHVLTARVLKEGRIYEL